MILRFKLYTLAGATALISAPSGGDAFSPSQSKIASRARAPQIAKARPLSSLNPDWDNDDFLAALGGGKEQMDQAKEVYQKQRERREAMDAWRARSKQPQQKQSLSKPAGKQRNGPSLEFFKKMGLSGDQAQKQQQRPMRQQPQMGQQQPQMQLPQKKGQASHQFGQAQMQQPPHQMGTPSQQMLMQQPPQQQPPQFYDVSGNPVSIPMVYDASGKIVPLNLPPQPQQPQVNPGQSLVPTPFEIPLPPKTKGTDSPRPVGFNPDAYTMSNTADVYFAQLKQDSKVRKMARMSGDTERANQVFTDDSVLTIRDSWVENPYTKEKNLAEARAEIEGTVRLHVAGDEAPKISSGINYKEKLEQMKAKQQGRDVVAQAPTAAPALSKAEQPPTVAALSGAAPEVQQAPKMLLAPPKKDEPKVGMPYQAKVNLPKAGMQPAPPPEIEQPIPTNAVMPPTVVSTPAPATITTTARKPSEATDEDVVRRKVRTLQGLLLKHRGGPGFGSGRLRDPEATLLENMLGEVKGILRSEVGGGGASQHPSAPSTSMAAVESSEAEVARKQAVLASLPSPHTTSVAVAVPPLAEEATMVSTPIMKPTPDPLDGSLACVEATLKMYKDSSPSEREAMMIPLREVFMAAASVSNKYIAERELDVHRAAMEVGPSTTAVSVASVSMGNTQAVASEPMTGFPTAYAVTKPDNDEERVHSVMADRVENDKKLENVYNALVNARGEGGKLGLKNISRDEADALAEKLQIMRGVLLDELNNDS